MLAHTHGHTRTSTHVHKHAHTQIHRHISARADERTHTHVHTHTHAHVYTHTVSLLFIIHAIANNNRSIGCPHIGLQLGHRPRNNASIPPETGVCESTAVMNNYNHLIITNIVHVIVYYYHHQPATYHAMNGSCNISQRTQLAAFNKIMACVISQQYDDLLLPFVYFLFRYRVQHFNYNNNTNDK